MRSLKITKKATNRQEDGLDRYLQDIGKIDLITQEEEVKLAQRIKAGDKIALEKLTKANLRFVVSVSKQYQNQGLSLPDLINEGNIGLIKAAQRFDETRGFKFISYAVWWIRQSILQALAENSRTLRLPLNKIGRINLINKAYQSLEQELERAPTAGELSDAISINIEDVIESTDSNKRTYSLDKPLKEGDSSTSSLLDTLHSDELNYENDNIKNEQYKFIINQLLKTISPSEAKVLELYWGLNGKTEMTISEIGKKIGKSHQRARQLKESGMRKIKYHAINNNVRALL